MRTRLGFVSNSSSSSFVITSLKENTLTGWENIIKAIKENPERDIVIIGNELYEGVDVFHPTMKQKYWILSSEQEIMNKHWWRDVYAVIEPISENESKSVFLFPESDLPANQLAVIEVDKDYRSTDDNTTYEEFMERYDIQNEIY